MRLRNQTFVCTAQVRNVMHEAVKMFFKTGAKT